jgi:hypothetical protein
MLHCNMEINQISVKIHPDTWRLRDTLAILARAGRPPVRHNENPDAAQGASPASVATSEEAAIRRVGNDNLFLRNDIQQGAGALL